MSAKSTDLHERNILDISTLSEEELNEEIEKGYADMLTGRTKNAKKVFGDICKDYKIKYTK